MEMGMEGEEEREGGGEVNDVTARHRRESVAPSLEEVVAITPRSISQHHPTLLLLPLSLR